MIYPFIMLMAVLTTGCAGMMQSLPDEGDNNEAGQELVTRAQIKKEQAEADSRNHGRDPVVPMQRSCCSDLCHGFSKVKSVETELWTPYIICVCKNGKEFRVTRTKGLGGK